MAIAPAPITPVVDSLLHALGTGRAPDAWEAARPAVAADHRMLLELIAAGGEGYGVTRRVGHRHGESIGTETDDSALTQDEFQRDLLDSHRLPGRRWATRRQVRCITLAQAQRLSVGGTGIDPEIFDLVTGAAVDPTFAPPVPLDTSYSCGDVISGAWWTRGLLKYSGDRYLGPKQGLSLISGVYVHAGTTLASVVGLRGLRRALRSVATAVLVAGRAKLDGIVLAEERRGGGAPPLLCQAAATLPPHDPARQEQDPVAIRATASVLLAVERAGVDVETTLERVLTTPSDNPLLWHLGLVEQDSFMSVDLALSTSTMVEALLLVATWLERAIAWLCGGQCGLPADLRDGSDLGLIQVPKLALAHVERLRMEVSRRGFASGSSTSQGIEDLWTNGLNIRRQLDVAIETVRELLCLAGATAARAVAVGGRAADGVWDWSRVPGAVFRDDVDWFRSTFDWDSAVEELKEKG